MLVFELVFVCERLYGCSFILSVIFVIFKFFFMASTCVCVAHVFSLGALLFRCDASCLTCVGPSRGNCSSCSSGHSLQDGVCVVNTECTDGQSSVFFLYYVFGSLLSDKHNSTLTHFFFPLTNTSICFN